VVQSFNWIYVFRVDNLAKMQSYHSKTTQQLEASKLMNALSVAHPSTKVFKATQLLIFQHFLSKQYLN
jgi:adenine C2-methylase RlmN of 23S rRNA A2503 and tRNA A37